MARKLVLGNAAIAEGNTNARQAGIVGGLNVNFAVADERGGVPLSPHGVKSVEDMAGVRFANIKGIATDNGSEITL